MKKPGQVLFIEDNSDEAFLLKLPLVISTGDDLSVEWEESLGGGIERLMTGGFLEIVSKPGSGTAVTVKVPRGQ